MPRGVYKRKPRAAFVGNGSGPVDRGVAVLATAPDEALQDLNSVKRSLVEGGLPKARTLHRRTLGIIRNKALLARGLMPNRTRLGTGQAVLTREALSAVKRLSTQLGGWDNLKETIAVVDRLRGF